MAKNNSGISSAQISHLIWKDGAWLGGFWLLLLVAALGLMFILVGLKKPVEIFAVAGGGAGLVVFLSLAILVRKHGRNTIRMGIDPDTNKLWVERDGATHNLPNAGSIRALEIQKEEQGRLPGAVTISDVTQPTGGGQNAIFRLVAEYSSGEQETCPGTEFQKKREARTIIKKSKVLFDSQG